MPTSPPAFSRNGSTSPLGKLDGELPKQRISSQTLAELQRQAAEHGMPLAEFVRLLLDLRAFGADTLKKMHQERVDRVAGTGEGTG